MHDIKNSISDIIVSSTNTDTPNLKCSTGTQTLSHTAALESLEIASDYIGLKNKIITLYQDLLDAFQSITHSAVYP